MRTPAPSGLAALALAAAGAAQAYSIAAPWNGQPVWWLQLAALAVLAWCVNRSATPRAALLAGWLFSTVWLVLTWWWLYVSLHVYGGLPAWLTVPSVLALAALLALYYAAACAAFVIIAPSGLLGRAAAFAALWLLAELAREVWFTGFPWGAISYAHVDGPLAGYAPWAGAFGICFATAWLAMVLARLRDCNRLQMGAALAVVLAPLAWQWSGQEFSRPAGSIAVTLLQGNIPQDEKFETGSGVPLALQWYAQQLRDARTPLVVAPETAIPMLPQQLPDGYWDALRQRFASGGEAALLGMPLGSYKTGYANSAVGFAPGREMYRYDKHHLVPFGEFIPPLFRWFTDLMHIPLGDFGRGAVGQASMEVAGQRLAPNICYEDLFGEEIGARFEDEAGAPTILVNMSNIGWFGDTIAIDQHLQISRMRTLEFERPMIRATNTGPTVIIDYRALVTQALPRLTRGALVGEVQGRAGLTPYAWWVARLGLWPWWLLGGLTLLVCAGLRRRRSG